MRMQIDRYQIITNISPNRKMPIYIIKYFYYGQDSEYTGICTKINEVSVDYIIVI